MDAPLTTVLIGVAVAAVALWLGLLMSKRRRGDRHGAKPP